MFTAARYALSILQMLFDDPAKLEVRITSLIPHMDPFTGVANDEACTGILERAVIYELSHLRDVVPSHCASSEFDDWQKQDSVETHLAQDT